MFDISYITYVGLIKISEDDKYKIYYIWFK